MHSPDWQILGVLTYWRKPGNLDKKRTRTYLWGRCSGLGQMYQMAALALLQLYLMSDSAMSLDDALWMALPEAVPPGLSSRSARLLSICTWALFIHGIRVSVFDPWWVVSMILGWMGVEASVLVGKLVDGWPLAKSLLHHFGRPSRARGPSLSRPW
jgi:hypothetical protein